METALLLAGLALAQDDPERLELFEKKIRPVLAERCYKCHSRDGEGVKGGLFLDTREGILKGGDSGPAVVPGEPDRSPLIRAIRYLDDDLQMPPKSRLTPQQVADFESWVRLGAPDPRTAPPAAARPAIDFAEARKFWSFQPPKDPPGSVDALVLARLREKGLQPGPPADKRTLLRRVTFDLTGLPPAPEEVQAFLEDESSGAFAKVVDRLLASPPYGERWGRHWLDLVRYADTAGDSADYPVPQAYRYRNYVIDAFNRDKPYDRFVREQIAGDLLPAGSEAERREGIVATGFLAIARRFGEEPTADHHLTIEDTIDTLGRVVMGLTLACARCHDHKFDPIPQEDYTAIYGIFQSTRFPYAGSDKARFQKDFVPLLPKEEAAAILQPYEEGLAAFDAEIKPLEEEIAALERELGGGKGAGPRSGRSLAELRKAAGDARKKRDAFAKARPPIEDAYAVGEGTPADAPVHLKGNPRAPGNPVPRRFLQVFGGEPVRDPRTSGRLDLADWAVGNPLAARVMVNRIWQHHFGKGLVPTPSTFGRQGAPPTHPELLDYLARRFVESGWSVKAMHRLILNSETYRRSSATPAGNERVDPANDYLWRFSRRRLEAEAIRDALLAVSGRLDPRRAGPHPFPAPKTWDFSKSSPFNALYATNARSVYLLQPRLRKHPYLALFDGPDSNASTAGRGCSTTPLQALFMMNDPFVQECARAFAERLGREPDEGARIDLAHRLAFGRPARPEEVARGRKFLAAGWEAYARVLLSANEFIFVD